VEAASESLLALPDEDVDQIPAESFVEGSRNLLQAISGSCK
jgi:hypothetical protein